MEVVARNYDLSYNTPVYDFDIHMEVQMTKFNGYLVPRTLRYTGTWMLRLRKGNGGYLLLRFSIFNE